MKKALTPEEFNLLLRGIGRRKKHALETFYSFYGKMIYSVALSVCRSSATADEIVDDVLVKIWKLAPDLSAQIENPEGWLYTITANTAKNKLTERELPLEGDRPSPDPFDGILEQDAFFRRIGILDETDRAIMIYRFVHDMQFAEIAAAMDLPLGTLTSRYYRALEKLKNAPPFS